MVISLVFLLAEKVNHWKLLSEKLHGKYDIPAVVEKIDQREEKVTINASKIMLTYLDFARHNES